MTFLPQQLLLRIFRSVVLSIWENGEYESFEIAKTMGRGRRKGEVTYCCRILNIFITSIVDQAKHFPFIAYYEFILLLSDKLQF